MSAKPTAKPILVTGVAGFIGMHIAERLFADGHEVVGADNLNDYYDPALKQARLDRLKTHPEFRFVRVDLASQAGTQALFDEHRFDIVLHLGVQAGLRYSLENSRAYTSSNIDGTLNVLEGCRH